MMSNVWILDMLRQGFPHSRDQYFMDGYEGIAQTFRHGMKIHLSKPGGQREGPFTLEQINRDLRARKYHDSDYWAWYDGLEAWIPLHAVPGVMTGAGGATEFVPKQEEQYAGNGMKRDPRFQA